MGLHAVAYVTTGHCDTVTLATFRRRKSDEARETALGLLGQSPLFPRPKRTTFESVIDNNSSSRSPAV
jgi:hypothetical protein